jgi:outer membrane biosynthesis protein TonB
MEKMIAGEMDIPIKKEKTEPQKKEKKKKQQKKATKKPETTKKSEKEKIKDVENTVDDIEKELDGLEEPQTSATKGVETEAVRRFKKNFVKSGSGLTKDLRYGAGELNETRLFSKYPASPAVAAKRSIKKLENLSKEANISLDGVNLTPDFKDEFDVQDTILAIAEKIVEI